MVSDKIEQQAAFLKVVKEKRLDTEGSGLVKSTVLQMLSSRIEELSKVIMNCVSFSVHQPSINCFSINYLSDFYVLSKLVSLPHLQPCLGSAAGENS